MIFENPEEIKKVKAVLFLVQNSKFPELKGQDALALCASCDWLYKECLKGDEQKFEEQPIEEKVKKKNGNK